MKNRPVGHELSGQRVPRQLDSDQLAFHAFNLYPLERFLADEARRRGELEETLESCYLERVVLEPHVGPVVEDSGLDPPRLARSDRHDAVRLARRHHAFPKVITAA